MGLGWWGGGELDAEEEGELLLGRLRPREVEELWLSMGILEDDCSSEEVVGFLRLCGTSPQWAIRISESGRSLLSTGTLATLSRISLPETTWPNKVCLAFRCSQEARVMKNLRYAVISIPYCINDSLPPSQINSLTAVSALSPIRHAHQPFFINGPPADVFVFKFSTINTRSTCSIPLRDVSSLYHEFIDDAVEG